MAFDDGGQSRTGAALVIELLAGLSLVDTLAVMTACTDSVAGVVPRDLDGPGALAFFDATYESGDRLTAAAAQALPVVDSDGLWAIDARTFPAWVADRLHVTRARANRLTRLGRALRDELPRTAASVVSGGPGRVNTDVAEILVRTAATSAARRDALVDPASDSGEQFLLAQARTMPADEFRDFARHWAVVADPEADDRGYREATDSEHLDASATTDGYLLRGFLTTEHGQALLAALAAVIGVPAKDDTRTSAQRRGCALGDLARVVLDHGLKGSSAVVRPHLNVMVDYPTFVALATAAGVEDQLPIPYGDVTITGLDALTGASTETLAGTLARRLNPATFEDGQPVPWKVLQRLACDGEITRMVFGPDSQILNVGRTKRIYPAHLRRAVIARDKHCQYPTCGAPPPLCEVHHSKHWCRDHGDTDVTAGVLLCYYHHTVVHNNDIEIRWKIGGGWAFTDRHGKSLERKVSW